MTGSPRASLGRAARLVRARGAGDNPAAAPRLPWAQLELAERGPAPLVPSRVDPDDPGAQLRIAAIIPSFRRGSGGHATIVNVLEGLRGRGHEVSLWLEDCEGRHAEESQALVARSFGEFFGAELELHKGLAGFDGADVVLATGWQTVARTQMLKGAGGRAYLVQDHEPEFYGASAEALWAAESYRAGLHCIAASQWLAALLRERYGASATHFDLAVDHSLYAPDGAGGADGDDAGGRAQASVAFYARALTPRRAVPLGLLALAELARRREEVEIVLYGEDRPLAVPFAHRNAGILGAPALARLYRESTVGMVLSLTNPSLVALEMMAAGLPCVELASEAMITSFGREGPLALAEGEPLALCAALEGLLDDPAQRERAALAGTELIAGRTWDGAAAQVEEGLRAALRAVRRDAR
jgi:glycosyltransferase involved in cell wall biosynthesis